MLHALPGEVAGPVHLVALGHMKPDTVRLLGDAAGHCCAVKGQARTCRMVVGCTPDQRGGMNTTTQRCSIRVLSQQFCGSGS